MLGTAGAGSLLLEFTALSRLSGDPEFERVARKAFFAIWNRRTELGLLPNTINLASGVSMVKELSCMSLTSRLRPRYGCNRRLQVSELVSIASTSMH